MGWGFTGLAGSGVEGVGVSGFRGGVSGVGGGCGRYRGLGVQHP